MQRLALAALALSTLPFVQDAAPPAALVFQEPGNPLEPPERMRVEIGDEVLVFDVGGAARLADGREVRAAFEATRHLVIDGSFALDYPSAWKFVGVHGLPEPVDAWWSLNGPTNGSTNGTGGALYLRRHGRAAETIVEEYAANLAAGGWTGKRALELELDGRTVAGFGFDVEMPSFDRSPATRQTQEVFGWQEREGVAWLFVVTTLHGPVTDLTQLSLDLIEHMRAQDPDAAAAAAKTPGCTYVPELAAIVASFRFAR